MAKPRKVSRVTRRKKLARKSRRRQSGGANITLNCTLTPSSGVIKVNSSSDPTVTTSTFPNIVNITNLRGNIKSITFVGANNKPVAAQKVGMSGSDSGIRIKDLATQKTIVPSSSYGYTRPLIADKQVKLNSAVGATFANGIEISNINASNLGAVGTGDATFTITIGM